MKEEKKEGLSADVLLSLGVLIWGAYWLGGFFMAYETLPNNLKFVVYPVAVFGAICYYVGFWRVVKKKGRHTAWFLLSFTWLIGVAVIYLLPKHDIQSQRSTHVSRPVF